MLNIALNSNALVCFSPNLNTIIKNEEEVNSIDINEFNRRIPLQNCKNSVFLIS